MPKVVDDLLDHVHMRICRASGSDALWDGAVSVTEAVVAMTMDAKWIDSTVHSAMPVERLVK